ncbi:MAG: PIG-L deacetylase family protein [Desulfobacterales bacterium]|nr:PIG-L deacetylase family protein [Desulfobacterales bacterium]
MVLRTAISKTDGIQSMSTILAISAHPDDETLFGGGTLAKYAQQGHAVFILETTRGEGGEVGQPALTTQENLAAFREQEVRQAAHILGARDIFFLPFIDPYMEVNGIARRIDVPLPKFAAAIETYIRDIRPDLIITHGSNGEYGHPQHIYTHQATRLAIGNGRPDTALISWSAWHTPSERERILNQDDKADIITDVSPWHDVKVAAALCHKTQHAMFLRNSGAPSIADMVWKTETFHIWQGPLPANL